MEGYKNQNITVGEASETDSDEEIVIREIKNITPLKIVEQKTTDLLLNSIRGTVIDGEAPESDGSDDEIISFTNLNRSSEAYEVTESFSPALYANNRSHAKNIAINKINATCLSVLNDFIQASASNASRQLLETDQMLMQTQATLQQAGTAIKKFNHSSTLVSNKLHNMLSSNFIPSINNIEK